MFYDLNLPIPAPPSSSSLDLSHSLSQSLSFSHSLGYNCVALSRTLTGKVPADPRSLAITIPVGKEQELLTRLTYILSDPSQNHRLSSLQPIFSILALRPTTEKTFLLCCQSLECDLISLDFSVRLPFILKFKPLAVALSRGIRFEICYSPGLRGGPEARRNLISGATALIRATRGRGIIVSSEASSALGLRAPWDVVNLLAVWGLSQERGKEAVCEESRKVVQLARLRRDSFRGVVDGIAGGDSLGQKLGVPTEEEAGTKMKRKASNTLSVADGADASREVGQPMSKTQMKKRAKKAKQDAEKREESQAVQASNSKKTRPTERSK